MKVWEALAEDLSRLGGPMGTETTSFKRLGLFSHRVSAKQACEQDYRKPIDWHKTHRGESSPDLGYVMYHVREVEIK